MKKSNQRYEMKQAAMWRRLGQEVVDLVVIGGGINGAGVAREAARRGISVALVEKNDLASGTSSRSSKLVHGGLRYLETAEFHLVFESVNERRRLIEAAPHIVKPLGFLFPIYKTSRISLPLMHVGMWIYEALAKFDSPHAPQKLSVEKVQQVQPALSTEEMTGASLYFDAATDDARLTLENAIDAAEHGAIISTWTECVDFIHSVELDDEESDVPQVCGIVAKNRLTGETKRVVGRAVINTTGPWSDEILNLESGEEKHLLRPTKGVHLVLPAERLPIRYAVLALHPDDERVMFILPWGNETYVGTTDTDFDGDPDHVFANAEDVDYLLRAVSHFFPKCDVSKDDVVATWAGLRPLVAPKSDGDKMDESKVSREHQVLVSASGLISLSGGKLTTYRLMAIDTVDAAVAQLKKYDRLHKKVAKDGETVHARLPGAVNWPINKKLNQDDGEERYLEARRLVVTHVEEVAGGVISKQTCEHLVDHYGMRASKVARIAYAITQLAEPLGDGVRDIGAQVVWAVEQEFCATVSDFMIQRTQIYFRVRNHGREIAPKVADLMQPLLGWSDTERQEMLDAYFAIVDKSLESRGIVD